ncbi:T-cell receptor alpha chain V region CTL-L17 [Myotis brandtii]|nr:T-cell receptor alpha chain V region CTL-L17 [Myotis brandtii]
MEQNPQSLSIQESEKAVLTCSYANYSPVFFQWYRQDPGRGPIFLLLIRENERTKLVGRLRATFDTTIKQSSFYITASQPADSATYLCAAGTQQGPTAHFLHPNPSGRQGRAVAGDPANHPQSTELLAVQSLKGLQQLLEKQSGVNVFESDKDARQHWSDWEWGSI